MKRHARLAGLVQVLISWILIGVCCHPALRGPVPDRNRELLGVFEEKFENVRKNADGKINVDLDLGHRDGVYIEGDHPYVFVSVSERAHVRLLYVTVSGEVLQKFPPAELNSENAISGFGSDLFDQNVRHRIPETDVAYRFIATLPPGMNNGDEIVIAIASSISFGKLDSLIVEKRNRLSNAGSRAYVKDNVVNLGIILYPESVVLKWAPLVFDLVKNLFLDRKTGYRFGYAYRIVTIKK